MEHFVSSPKRKETWLIERTSLFCVFPFFGCWCGGMVCSSRAEDVSANVVSSLTLWMDKLTGLPPPPPHNTRPRSIECYIGFFSTHCNNVCTRSRSKLGIYYSLSCCCWMNVDWNKCNVKLTDYYPHICHHYTLQTFWIWRTIFFLFT